MYCIMYIPPADAWPYAARPYTIHNTAEIIQCIIWEDNALTVSHAAVLHSCWASHHSHTHNVLDSGTHNMLDNTTQNMLVNACRTTPHTTCWTMPHTTCWTTPHRTCWTIPHTTCWTTPQAQTEISGNCSLFFVIHYMGFAPTIVFSV